MATETLPTDLPLSDAALDQIFRSARTHSAFLPTLVPESTLREVYDLMKWGPTSANTCPLRILFLTTEEARQRIVPLMSEANREKTAKAPVVAVLAYDPQFYELLPKLFPIRDIRAFFAGNAEFAERAALLNSSLQAAYFFIALRALGLDAGPMAGFDAEAVNNEFFPDGSWKATIVCNVGYGEDSKLNPRLPRLEFDEACRIL